MKASSSYMSFGDHELGPRGNWEVSRLFLIALVGVTLTGCNSAPSSNIGPGQTNPARPYVAAGVGNLQTYSIDHTANSFVVTSYGASGGTIQGSGSLSQLPNGILDLNNTYLLGQVISSPPLTGNWVVEMPGQAALMELETTNTFGTNTSFAPLAPTQSCPSLNTAASFQFVTIPKKLSTIPSLGANGWNPQLETAYGSVSIATSGATVQFTNISQHTFPAGIGGAAGSPVNPASPTATSAC